MEDKKGNVQGYQFGSFQGVFMPSILTILGVVMYLRMGWVLGHLGLWETLLVVTLATSITFLTALSISELATNMKVGGGGAYYIISRSLGVEAGAAIGLPLFIAQALGISFYVAGFAESLLYVFPDCGLSATWIGVATLAVLTLLAAVSTDLALRFQFVILTLIMASLVSFFLGSNEGMSSLTPVTAAVPHLGFWAVFAVFFPAVTGIEAGLSMSGDLKNTERSLPRGTLAAIALSYGVYLAIPIFLAWLKVDRSVLLANSMVMHDVARWGVLIVLGLWGASISSALGALLGAPRTLQAMARDGVLPKRIGQGFGKQNDPRLATMISFLVALAGVTLGDLNIIAPILSMFFLTSYGLLNLSAALEGLLNNPSWRPKFNVHWGFSLLGAMGCVLVMLMINIGATFAAFLLSAGVYYLMKRRQINAYWGDMRYGILMLIIRSCLYRLTRIKPHEKTWRPNILVLSGSPNTRWHLIALADAISHGKGFLTVATILSQQVTDNERLLNIQQTVQTYLKEREVPAIVKVTTAADIMQGAQDLVMNYGFGPLMPNTILLGGSDKSDHWAAYISLVLLIARQHRNLVIVRETEEKPLLVERPRIDLWWRRLGDNSGLMLALAYLLKTSPEWQDANFIIKTIADNEDQRIELEQQLVRFIKKENMEAAIEVYVKTDEVYAMIKKSSQGAHLVFLGLRPPDEDEAVESYRQYYQDLLTKTEGLPTMAMVLAAEKIDFDAIFQLRQ